MKLLYRVLYLGWIDYSMLKKLLEKLLDIVSRWPKDLEGLWLDILAARSCELFHALSRFPIDITK